MSTERFGTATVGIIGGTVVLDGGATRATIVIEDGRIKHVASPQSRTPRCDVEIDAEGLVVLPGAVDAHTHFIVDDPDVAAPNTSEFEGLEHGGRAAAAGGVTCVVEMPHSTPPTIDGASFRRKRDLAAADATVDFALWGGVVPDQSADAIGEQLHAGAAAFKAYMCGSDPLFPGVDDARLLDALQTVAPSSVMLAVHAENDALLSAGVARMQDLGRRDPLAHAESRPPLVEAEAVKRAITLSEHAGAHLHVVHLTHPAAANIVKEAKARGARVTAETCPQYLVMTQDDLARLGGMARCAPPLREPGQADRLWEYVADGTLDCVTSDHCAFTAESKAGGLDDIWSVPEGVPGVQTLLPIMVSEGRSRGLSWEAIARLTATRPAELWGLRGRKGAIRIGLDGDIVLVDPSSEWLVAGDDMRGAHRWTPYAGRRLRGRVVRTLRRGETVFEAGAADELPAQPGSGRFVAARHTDRGARARSADA